MKKANDLHEIAVYVNGTFQKTFIDRGPTKIGFLSVGNISNQPGFDTGTTLDNFTVFVIPEPSR